MKKFRVGDHWDQDRVTKASTPEEALEKFCKHFPNDLRFPHKVEDVTNPKDLAKSLIKDYEGQVKYYEEEQKNPYDMEWRHEAENRKEICIRFIKHLQLFLK